MELQRLADAPKACEAVIPAIREASLKVWKGAASVYQWTQPKAGIPDPKPQKRGTRWRNVL